VSVYPVLFLGNDKVWVKNVQLVDLGPAKPRSESCVKFNSNEWKMTAHVNGEVAILPKEVRWKKANDEFKYHGSLALKLNYVFPSTKHDANMFTSDVEIADGAKVVFPVYGDASGHELFLVLFDKSNEAHFLSLGAVDWNGWKMIDASIKELLKGPSSRYDVSCRHWGGDGNQRLDLPITKITIGINDKPDSFSGKGEIGFAWIKFYK
jgi:hypothetical protein